MISDILFEQQRPDYKRYWVGAAIAGASALGLGISSWLSNKNSTKRQYKYNLMAMQEQNKMNQDNYNKYMSPEAQMRQYQEAGLNPNLIYNNAQPSAPDVAQVPAREATPSLGSQLPGIIGNSISAAWSGYNSEIERKRQDEYLDIARDNAIVSQHNAAVNQRNSFFSNQLKSSQSRNYESKTLSEQIKQKYLDHYWSNKNRSIDIENAYNSTRSAMANLEYGLQIQFGAQEMQAKIDQMVASGKLSKAKAAEAYASVNYMKTLGDKLVEETKGITEANRHKAFTNSIDEMYYEYLKDLEVIDKEGKIQYQNARIHYQDMVNAWSEIYGPNTSIPRNLLEFIKLRFTNPKSFPYGSFNYKGYVPTLK